MKTRNSNNTTETRKSETRKNQKAQNPKNYRVADPIAMLKARKTDAIAVIEELREAKSAKRSEMSPKYRQLAYRLAMVGIIAANTLAKDAEDRVYRATAKTNVRALTAALAQ